MKNDAELSQLEHKLTEISISLAGIEQLKDYNLAGYKNNYNCLYNYHQKQYIALTGTQYVPFGGNK